MFAKFLPAFVAGLALASANTLVARDPPSGNAITKPTRNEIVPAGMPYTIAWNPTTPGTISLFLLRGPAQSLTVIATIAQGVPNTGTFSWTPSLSLDDDVTHYGLNLTVDNSNLYQYSDQFGISNPGKQGSSSTSSNAPTTVSTSATSSVSTTAATTTIITTTLSSSTSSTSLPTTTPSSGTESTSSSATIPPANSQTSSKSGGSTSTTPAKPQSTSAAAGRLALSMSVVFIALGAVILPY